LREHDPLGVDHPLTENHLVELIDLAARGGLLLATVAGVGPVGVIRRILAAGVDRELIAETLQCVIRPRLLRKLCEHCKKPDDAAGQTLRDLGVEEAEGAQFLRKVGCNNCLDTGRRHLAVVCQVLPVTDAVREAIRRGGAGLEEAAKEAGLRSLLAPGLELAREGIVSLDELKSLTP